MNPLLLLLIIILVLFAIVGVPDVGVWRHNYGYYPSGLGVILVVVLLVLLLR